MYHERSQEEIFFERNQIQMVNLNDLVPDDHLLKRIEKVIDFKFIYNLTKEYYSQENGRNCLDTIVLFKIMFLNFLTGKNSIRATLEETKVNLAYKWFLGLGINSKVPNHSTVSQNYIRRFSGTDVFEKVFTSILTQIIEKGLIDSSIIYVDGTHIKANANKHKSIKKQVRVLATKYQKDLETEVNEFRELNGRDKYPTDDDGYTVDDETGEIIETNKEIEETKTISTVDSDCGMFVKGEHERQFAYVDQVACDKHGWILGFDVNPGNMHDAKAFLPFFEKRLLKYLPKVICADAGYANNLIAYNVQNKGIELLIPYIRPKGKTQQFNKKLFDYYIEIDSYICPSRKQLVPWNINKNGYIEYKIHRDECSGCIYQKECLKNYAFKTIRRHIYEDCLDKAKEYRLSKEGKEIYSKRKETIERIFAEGKEKHGLRFTRYKGRQKNFDMRALLYACLNIKKLANYLIKKVNKQEEIILEN